MVHLTLVLQLNGEPRGCGRLECDESWYAGNRERLAVQRGRNQGHVAGQPEQTRRRPGIAPLDCYVIGYGAAGLRELKFNMQVVVPDPESASIAFHYFRTEPQAIRRFDDRMYVVANALACVKV